MHKRRTIELSCLPGGRRPRAYCAQPSWTAAAICALIFTATPASPCATAPVALDDATVVAFEPVLVDVLANDTDAEGDALAVALVRTTCPGSASVVGDALLIEPGSPLTADCTVTYRVTDENGLLDSATVHMTGGAPAALFADGFETGSASRWSACEPSCN